MSQSSSAPVIDRPDVATDPAIDEAFGELTGFREQVDDGSEKDRFSHYVSKEDIVRAAVDGVSVVALCGKKWRPSRNPEKYPVCPTCQEIHQQMQPGDDE